MQHLDTSRVEHVAVMDDAPVIQLPEDPAALKALCTALSLHLAERDAKISKLGKEILWLRKQLYGPRADRLTSTDGIGQMLLEFAKKLEAMPAQSKEGDGKQDGEGTQDGTDGETPAKASRRVSAKGRHGRRRIADLDHLPATTIEHDLSEAEKRCSCCDCEKRRIGKEESWQVEYVPGRFERWHHIRYIYVCSACDAAGNGGQVATAEKSPEATKTSPIEKGMAGPGLLAMVVTSKFADYLPLYRLENIFKRNGLDLSRSTLCQWCHDVAEIGEPVYDLMCDRVRMSHLVATDDTVMPLLAPGKTIRARMWSYIGDDDHPYNVFDFTRSRARDGPTTFLAGYSQTLLADAYGGYNGVVVGNGMTRAGCWAHARRKFIDAESSEPAVAREAVAIIDALFALERRVKASAQSAVPEDLATVRNVESRAVTTHLHGRLLSWKAELLPRSPMAAAVQYALNQWAELTVFLDDPAVPMDNNACEREMKRQAINRKNSLFVGSERGGRTAAILSSFTSTCRRHDIDPQRYLTQLLVNLPGWPASDIAAWLPDEWKRRQAAR